MYDIRFCQKKVMEVTDAKVHVVGSVSKKGNPYYMLKVVVAGKYEFSHFLNADQISILRLLGFIAD